MKVRTKLGALGIAGILAGAGATMYAAPGGLGVTDEVVTRGVALQNRMKADLETIAEMRVKAQRSRDVLKLNCVNDKLVLANPLMNVADHLVIEIESESGHSNAATTIGSLTANAEEMRRLRENAAQCVDALVLGAETSNSFTHPDATAVFGTSPTVSGYIEPPIYASPVR